MHVRVQEKNAAYPASLPSSRAVSTMKAPISSRAAYWSPARVQADLVLVQAQFLVVLLQQRLDSATTSASSSFWKVIKPRSPCCSAPAWALGSVQAPGRCCACRRQARLQTHPVALVVKPG